MSLTDSIEIECPNKYGIFVILNPVANYFGASVKPINIKIIDNFVRGRPKSAAGYKLAANYAPTVCPQKEVNKEGYHNILWTHDDLIAEIGACNIFFVIQHDNGERELLTPPTDGAILPGITRKTALELLRKLPKNDKGEKLVHKVTERPVSVSEIHKLLESDKVLECFGCGTAVVVAPVKV